MGILRENTVPILDRLESIYDLYEHISIYDQFIERQMSTTQSEETRRFLLPIWRLRSSFNDALRPIEESINSLLCREKMLLATEAIKAGRVHDKNVFEMMDETRNCHKTYETYLRRLKHLYNQTKHIFNTISYHKLNILDEYAEDKSFDPVAIRHHYNRIVFVLEMSIVIGESISDAMKNAKSVVRCARENLDTMASCYANTIKLQSTGQINNDCGSRFGPTLRPCPFLQKSKIVDVTNLTPCSKTSLELPLEHPLEQRHSAPCIPLNARARIQMRKPRVMSPREISLMNRQARSLCKRGMYEDEKDPPELLPFRHIKSQVIMNHQFVNVNFDKDIQRQKTLEMQNDKLSSIAHAIRIAPVPILEESVCSQSFLGCIPIERELPLPRSATALKILGINYRKPRKSGSSSSSSRKQRSSSRKSSSPSKVPESVRGSKTKLLVVGKSTENMNNKGFQNCSKEGSLSPSSGYKVAVGQSAPIRTNAGLIGSNKSPSKLKRISMPKLSREPPNK